MSLLDLLGRATLSTGVQPPKSYTKKVQAKGLASTADLSAAATTGYAFRSPTLGSDKYTDNQASMIADRGTPYDIRLENGQTSFGTLGTYQNNLFKDQLRGNNKATTGQTSALNSGNFKGVIGTYADRLFAQQQQTAGKFNQTPSSLISAASRTVPVLTPTATPGSPAGMPGDDGRYIPTVGYGYVLYVTRGTYG